MSILKQLMEMDPFMRPIGGPVCPPNTPIQSTTPQPDCTVPQAARQRLMDRLWKASAEEEEQEMGPPEPEEMEDEPGQVDMSPDNIISFIKNYPSPSAEDYEYSAEELGVSVEELHAQVHEIAAALLKSVGKHDDVPDEDFDPEQLQMGIEVEMEHTDNTSIAKMIAKDHLMELPDYYSRLKGVEQQGSQEDQAPQEDEFEDEDDDHDYGDGDTFGGEEDPQDEEEYR